MSTIKIPHKNLQGKVHKTFYLPNIATEILFNESFTRKGSGQVISERGDTLYYWKNPLEIHYADYIRSVALRLVIRPHESRVIPCDRSAYDAHDRVGGLPVRKINLAQPLGDTNIRGIKAVVDDRIPGYRYLRLLAVGLHPGPRIGPLFCHFPCSAGPGDFCSSRATGVVLLAGNHTNYPLDGERKSFMDVIYMSCPLSSGDLHPTQMTLTSRSCGYSHNYIKVKQLGSRNVVGNQRKRIGLCVRPSALSASDRNALVVRYIEYWRAFGIDHIVLYYSEISDVTKMLINSYETEDQEILRVIDWATVDKLTEEPVSMEAAVNHCVMTTMKSFDYIIVTSFDHIPVFMTNKTSSLKEVIGDSVFLKESGFKITGPEKSYSTFIIKPKDILATAADHFIPLSANPSFNMLHPFDITMVSMRNLWFNDGGLNIADIKRTVDAAALEKLKEYTSL